MCKKREAGRRAKRRITPGLLYPLLIAAMMVPMMTTGQSELIPDGLAEFVSAYERIWNTHDADAVAAYFAEDADMIMGGDPTVEGRTAIADSWRTYFDRIDEGRMGTFTIESARLISPEVAVINVDSITSARREEDRERLPTRLARGTWVIVKTDSGWSISALRGQPQEGESRTKPGTDH